MQRDTPDRSSGTPQTGGFCSASGLLPVLSPLSGFFSVLPPLTFFNIHTDVTSASLPSPGHQQMFIPDLPRKPPHRWPSPS